MNDNIKENSDLNLIKQPVSNLIVQHASTVTGQGKSGLTNTGNTCYMNSSLQALSHIELLTQYFFTNTTEIIEILKSNANKIFKEDFDFFISSCIAVDERLQNSQKNQ